MELNVSKKDLLKVLTTAVRAVPSKAVIPIMDCFLLDVADGKLSATATDGSITVTAHCDAEGEGIACVTARTLLEIVKTLPDCDIKLSTSDVVMTVDYGVGHSTLPCLPTEDFPSVTDADAEKKSCTLNGAALKDALRHALPCVSTDALRPFLNGVYFHNVDGKTFNIVATDSHVLSASPVESTEGDNFDSFIIPTNAASFVKDNIDIDDVRLEETEASVNFSMGSVTIRAQKIIGKYPNYGAIMPTANANVLTAETAPFASALRRIAICSNKSTQHIKLNLSDKVSIEAQDAGFGTYAKEELPDVTYNGTEMTVGFKFDVMMKVLGTQTSTNIDIKFDTPRKAILILGENEPTKSIVMPVAI